MNSIQEELMDCKYEGKKIDINEANEVKESLPLLKKSNYSEIQKKILFLFPLLNFLLGACVTLLPPFFPIESETKKVPASIYGFIIGVYHLVVLLLSPVFGKYIHITGANLMLNFGNIFTAMNFILFGFLKYVPGPIPFVILAFILRIAQGVGNAAFNSAFYSISAVEFPDNIAGIISFLQIGFVLGRISGPIMGGVLFEAGGFALPFVIVGTMLFTVSIFTSLLLPPMDTSVQNTEGILRLLKIPSIAISTYETISVTICVGLLASTLEAHLKQFYLEPLLLGFVFATDGVFATLGNAFWGYIAKKNIPLKLLAGCAALNLTFAFCIVGPVPFLPVKSAVWMVVLALALMGLNMGGGIIVPYVDIMQEMILNGYPKCIVSYAIVSGLWNSSRNIGLFLGSSLSGLLFDAEGFRNSSLLLVALQIVGMGLNFGYYFVQKYKST